MDNREHKQFTALITDTVFAPASENLGTFESKSVALAVARTWLFENNGYRAVITNAQGEPVAIITREASTWQKMH